MSPVFENTTPCWHAQCETCGEFDPRHFDTRAELVAELEACGWYIRLGLFNEPMEFHCKMCADEMIDRMRCLRHAWLE